MYCYHRLFIAGVRVTVLLMQTVSLIVLLTIVTSQVVKADFVTYPWWSDFIPVLTIALAAIAKRWVIRQRHM